MSKVAQDVNTDRRKLCRTQGGSPGVTEEVAVAEGLAPGGGEDQRRGIGSNASCEVLTQHLDEEAGQHDLSSLMGLGGSEMKLTPDISKGLPNDQAAPVKVASSPAQRGSLTVTQATVDKDVDQRPIRGLG